MIQKSVDRLLTAAGVVLFTGSRGSGILFLLALLLDPWRLGLALAGAVCGMGVGALMARERVWQEIGFFGGSGMLSALALAAYLEPAPQLLLLAPLTAALSALILLALVPLLAPKDLPLLALPFVLAALLALGAAPAFGLEQSHLHGARFWLLPQLGEFNTWMSHSLPLPFADGLSAFGSLLFFPAPLAGLLVLGGLIIGSRITALAMLAGSLLSTGLLRLLVDGPMNAQQTSLLAFNGLLLAAAFCGIFVALTRQALVYGVAALLSGILVTATLDHLLTPFGLPVLALPFCLVTLGFLLPLKSASAALERWRIWAPPLRLIGRAEDNLRAFGRWQRQQDRPEPVLTMPLHGTWTVTQGPHGPLTHNTETGRHAWDFMLLDTAGRGAGGLGNTPEDFFGFGCPVLAPAEGQVIAVEGQHADNPVHTANTDHPWGNWMMIRHASGTVSLLAHLRAGSLRALPGQHVLRGQEVAQLGNTGRSPEPHLHLQLNDGPWLASHSLPAVYGSWLSLKDPAAPVFHPVGRPQEGDRVCTLTHMHWPDWSACHPYSVPGRVFRYRREGRGAAREIELRVTAGHWGRLLLDDGLQRALVLYWPGWIQLLPLEDGDPDACVLYAEDSLVQQLLLHLPALPLIGVDGLRVVDDVYSPGLAGRVKKAFRLEGRASLALAFRRKEAAAPLYFNSRLSADGTQVRFAEGRMEDLKGLCLFQTGEDRKGLRWTLLEDQAAFHSRSLAT